MGEKQEIGIEIDDAMDRYLCALSDWMEAKYAHDRAAEGYDGYSWDWHGRDEIGRVDGARDEAKKAMLAVLKIAQEPSP